MEFAFLPSWPPQANGFLLFGAILLAGLIGGELAGRTRYLPRITGFIAVGLALGPSGLGLLTPTMLEASRLFVEIALGLILFQLGMQLDITSFRRDRRLLLAAVLESTGAFAALYLALTALGVQALHAALAAALGVSSSPAVVLLVVRQLGASGPVTQRSLSLVAFNNVSAFMLFTALLPWLHSSQQADIATAVLHPLYRFAGSLLLAWVLARLSIYLARLVGPHESSQFALLVSVIMLALGVAKALNLSQLFALLAYGVLCRNLDRRKALTEVEFGRGGEVFFVILFVWAGANLHLQELASVGLAAAVFVLARWAGKLAGLSLADRPTRAHLRQAALVSLTVMPMAGLAIGLVQTTQSLYPEFAGELAAIVLAAVAILETIGPIATEFALKRAGEVKADQGVDH